MYPLTLTILATAIGLQLFAAIAALSQIRRSGGYWPYWGCIATALLVMVWRRVSPFEAALASHGARLEALDQSLSGLAISILMAIGVLGLRRLFIDLDTQKDQLTVLSRRDALTGLWNRRHALELAASEFNAARRFERRLCAMMIDIDHFKRINDTLGHEAGDRTLAATARHLRDSVRTVDITGRLGGEEFLVLLPETGLQEAMTAAERVRQEFHQHWDAALPPLTVSIGVAELAPGDQEVADLIARADKALYQAKEAGRDRVAAA